MLDQGFKPVVLECERNFSNHLPFEKFREDYKTYHILLCNKDADPEALTKAEAIDPKTFYLYLKKKKPLLGYGNDPQVPYRQMDMCDSHHILMSQIIANYKKTYPSIIEIGAGYGNMIRLNENILDYRNWIDIDLPFVTELASWYLNKTLTDPSKIDFISAYDYVGLNSDLVIAAHSLSELAMDDFMEYYNRIVLKTKTFFYSTHLTNCGEEMLKNKLEIISKDFELIYQVTSEGGGVLNNLYSRLQPPSHNE